MRTAIVGLAVFSAFISVSIAGAINAQAEPPLTAGSVTDEVCYMRAVNPAAGAPLAAIDPATGKLHYGAYANRGQENADHIIPDFSYAGYKGGGVALPSEGSIPVRISLAPDGEADDLERINAALQEIADLPVDERGIRGALLLEAGAWQANGQIIIPASGIVLRGQGQGKNGTVITATSTANRDTLIVAKGVGSGRNPRKARNSNRIEITQPFVPVGSNTVEIASTDGYQVGDTIGITRTPNDKWIGADGVDMVQYGWAPKRYKVVFERTVIDIAGNTLTFDIPMVDTIDAQFGGGEVYRTDTSARLQQISVENLRLETLRYKDVKRQDRAFFGIVFEQVENAWIRDVTIGSFSQAFVMKEGTRFVTVQDVAAIDPNFEVRGGNHYAFGIQGGAQILFQRCYAHRSRHAFIGGSTLAGPNVFLDCMAVQSDSDSGPHHRWATGTLYDNINDQLWRAQNRTDAGSGHGWAGAQELLWNSVHGKIVLQAPPFAMNYAVGNIGAVIRGSRSPSEPNGIIESKGKRVTPRSLYLQQLQDRLGPEAVIAVTTQAQRRGPIWAILSERKGEGKADDEATQ